ncbi:MAG: cobalt ECF transporter T component CbiQ [Actinomycetes bacterium]
MGAGHAHRLVVHADTPVHHLPAHTKLVALLGFVVVVVATPRTQVWAFCAYAVLLAVVVRSAKVPFRIVARRSLVELPFVVFALLLPFLAHGPQVEVLGLSLSEDGLLGGWNILAKGTLGVVAATVLAATTDPRDVVVGLSRLRVPSLLVQIVASMVRYVDVVAADLARMKVARESRCFDGRGVRALPVVAQAAGALFVRTYERGERVHLAMLSRGYTGTMPRWDDGGATRAQWCTAALLPAAALGVALAARMAA